MTSNGGVTCGSVTVRGPLYAITCEEDVLLVDQEDLGALNRLVSRLGQVVQLDPGAARAQEYQTAVEPFDATLSVVEDDPFPWWHIWISNRVMPDMPALALAAGPMVPEEGDGLDAMVNGLAHLRDALREAILAPHRVAL
jgi:hypothetical protein